MIISTGLRKLIEMRNEFEVVAVIADCFHCLERINHLNPDIIIINPSAVELKKRQHLEELFEGVKDTAFVALVYQYIDPEILKQYHTTIDIADDGDKIAQKLLHSIDALSAPADLLDKNELSERDIGTHRDYSPEKYHPENRDKVCFRAYCICYFEQSHRY